MKENTSDNLTRAVDRRECLRWLLGTVAVGMLPSCMREPGSVPAVTPRRAKTALVYDPVYTRHLAGTRFYERPERCGAIIDGLKTAGLSTDLARPTVRVATQDELTLCHTKPYIETAKRDVEAGATVLSTGDTPLSKQSFDVALHAVGGVLSAVDTVVASKAANAFCVVRPPGHHASASCGMGFCIFNNIAVAARYAQKRHGIEKVLISDWDVHHGNGTQDIFYEDGSVFFCSTHQSPWYPGTGKPDETGKGKGLGCTLNLPFPAGSGRKEIVAAVQDKLLPAADRFKPDLVLISAGFDSRKDDPLGRFALTDRDFADLTKLLLGIAARHAEGRLISVLEGGYNLSGLALASAAHVGALAEGPGSQPE